MTRNCHSPHCHAADCLCAMRVTHVQQSAPAPNAKLIAAAPGMLASIRKVLPHLPPHPDGCTWCVRCELTDAIRGLE